MGAYRFIHAADVHLDSPLKSLALRDPDLAELIGNATRRALIRIVDLCIHEQVNALLLAGDLYDGDQTSMKTARFLAEQVGRLHEAGIKVFVIRGNHDALSRITKELILPDTVTIFGSQADAVIVDRERGHIPVAIHGLSFAQPHAPETLVGKYKPIIEGAVNIGIMHTSLAGASEHDPYAPCSPADLHGTGFQYWALGHIHKRSVLTGACTIVMPGMPQGRDINEAGAKSVTLVTVGDDRSVKVEERDTSIAQFERISVDATGLTEWRDLVTAIEHALGQARSGVAAQHLVARIQITGTTPLAWRMRSDHDLLKAEADSRASAIGACWVEKLEVTCYPPGEAAGLAPSPLHELRRLINDEVLQSDAFQSEFADIVSELRGQLPAESRRWFGDDEAAFKAQLAILAHEGTEDILARLHAAEEA